MDIYIYIHIYKYIIIIIYICIYYWDVYIYMSTRRDISMYISICKIIAVLWRKVDVGTAWASLVTITSGSDEGL